MAIAQSRVIALIDAANDYRQALHTLISLIHTQNSYTLPDHDPEPMHPAEALHFIVSAANAPSLLRNHTRSSTTIAKEHHHFATHARLNKRKADYMAARRREAHKDQRLIYDADAELAPLLSETPEPSSISEAEQLSQMQAEDEEQEMKIARAFASQTFTPSNTPPLTQEEIEKLARIERGEDNE